MKEKAIGKVMGGLLICLMFVSVFGGLIDTTSATTEKTTVSVTESSPWFTKGTNSGSGPWYPHTYEGHDYISTYVGGMSTNPSQPDCWAEFKPYLSQSGKYEAYAYFYACKDTSTKVPFTVRYEGGSTTINVNQYRSSPAWKEKYLGTWNFKAGADTYVKVTDATGETYNGITGLSVGTIKFVKVQTTTVPSPPTLISPGSSSEPGQEINTLTPTFNWNSVSNADYYGLYVSKYPYGSGNIVFEKEGIYGTSFILPSGKLQDGVMYRWNMRAHNSAGWSGFSSKLYFTVDIPNSPPNTPSKPSGPSSGYTGTSYSYSTSATDPDGDQVKYAFDWGDGATSETSFVNSGTSAGKSHSWSSAGTYYVKAKAADCKGSSSEWSSSKTITIKLVEEPTDFWVEVSNPAGAYICNDSVDYTFGRNLKLGDSGDDVKYLQIVLNANPATQVAVEGPGSPCHETNYFGVLTEAAVIKFQTLHEGLTQSGELDEATRAELNKLCLPVKHVPNGWVLNVTNTHQSEEIQDGCVWWEVEDVTDGIKGWVAYQKISDETKYLEVDDQEELKNRVNKLNTERDRITVIRQEVSGHRTEFLPANFPLGLILAMAIQESGGDGFDNEIVALTPWGRGIMQIDTDNYVGAGSGIRWYNNGAVDYCRGKEGHGCTCSAGICYCDACKHHYTNTIQGIEANIKDSLGALKDKYKNSNCCYNRGENAEWDEVEGLYREEMGEGVIFYSKNEECEIYDSKIEKIGINNIEISCDDFKVIDTVWRYNCREIYSGDRCEKSDYLRCVADRLNEIERTFGYEMPNKDTWIESLKAVSRSASVMKKIK